MTIAGLYTALNSTDALKGRVFYSHKTASVKLPFCFIENTGAGYEYADNTNFAKVGDNCAVELYTAKFDPTTEAVIEGVFTSNEITFTKVSSYDNDGNFYLVAYDITLTN